MKTYNLKKIQHFINLRKLTKTAALCISALFILSIISVFSSFPVQAATTSTFGNTAVGTYIDQNDANAQSISYFKSTTTGSVTNIIAYVSGASSGKATAALYAINGNSPSTLLAQSSSANLGTSYSWVDFQLTTPYTVTSGTTYGLAIMGNVPVNLRIVAGTGQRTGGPGDGSYSNGFTNPFGAVWFNDLTGAMSIYATGTSSTTPAPTSTPTTQPTSTPTTQPTPAPTSTLPIPPPNGNNLAPIPYAWGDYLKYGDVYYSTGNQISHVDYSVLHNGHPSIRIDAHTNADPDPTRELDSKYYAIVPGEHVFMSVWVKTGAATNGDPYGARMGLDFYAQGIVVDGLPSSGGWGGSQNYFSATPQNPSVATWTSTTGVCTGTNVAFVPWGRDWTQLTYDFIVPDKYYTNGSNDLSLRTPSPTQIDGMILWLDARQTSQPASAWFADAELYITI